MTPRPPCPAPVPPATCEVAVLGGGVSGLAAAWRLARAGRAVTLLEREPDLGGQARGFRRDGRRLPIAYHHVNPADRALLTFLRATGILPRVRWRPVDVACLVGRTSYVLASPRGLLTFPASVGEKARMAALAVGCWLGRDDLAGGDLDAAAWLRREVGGGTFARLFEDLVETRLGVPADEVSAAWLRARIASREGATRFGYLPCDDWAGALVDALAARATAQGAALCPACPVAALSPAPGGGWDVRLADGCALRADAVVAALPPPLLACLLPPDRAAVLPGERWSFVVSAVMEVPLPVPLPHYWTNVVRPSRVLGTVFRLDRLNPTLGRPGVTVLNLAAYGIDAPGALVREPPERVLERFGVEWTAIFGAPLRPRWAHVTHLPAYAPVLPPRYWNPDHRLPGAPEVWLAGHALTWPQVASTGPALASGWAAAGALLRAHGVRDEETVG